MNTLDLTHLETLLAAATPGPWFNDQEDPIVESATEMIGQNILAGSHERDLANTELIVALRNAAPALIARVRELENPQIAAMIDWEKVAAAMHDRPGFKGPRWRELADYQKGTSILDARAAVAEYLRQLHPPAPLTINP